jgi:hypothetical protein
MKVPPTLIFYLTSGLLIVGLLTDWWQGDGPLPALWIACFVVLLAASSTIRVKWSRQRPVETIGRRVDVVVTSVTDIFCIIVLGLVAALFASRGVPLLSANTNVARVTFFADASVLAKAFSLLPAVIAVATASIGTPAGRRMAVYGIAACLAIVLAGNKAAIVNIVLAALLGYWATGRKIPLWVLAVCGVGALLFTLSLFSRVVNEAEMATDAWQLLWTRITDANSQGLRVCVSSAEHVGSNPVLIGFRSLLDRLAAVDSGYPISTGRYLTAYYYAYGALYDPVWEFTVTGYCDSYLLGGEFGVALFAVAMIFAVRRILGRLSRAKTALGAGLLALAFVHLLALYSGGNFVAQLLGFIGQGWLLVAAILVVAWTLTAIVTGGRGSRTARLATTTAYPRPAGPTAAPAIDTHGFR